MAPAGGAGVWLFYVQHQFEGVYWARHDAWSFYNAGMQGSSLEERDMFSVDRLIDLGTALPAIGVGLNYDNRDNPGYAVGETLHAQLSWIASLGPSVIAREASFVGEIAWNTRHKVTRNEQMLNPNADRSATAVRMVYSPTYRQALSGLDLSPYVGLGYTWGKSSAVGPAFGVDKGGDISIGVRGVYLGEWVASLNLIRYLGPEGPTLDNSNNTQFKQALKDHFNALVPELVADPGARGRLASLRTVVLGGEQVAAGTVHRFMECFPRVRVVNLYGPTECSIGSIHHTVTAADGDRIPIGRPIANTSALVLDRDGRLVPAGVRGEIHLGGRCLGPGYLGDPARTAAASR